MSGRDEQYKQWTTRDSIAMTGILCMGLGGVFLAQDIASDNPEINSERTVISVSAESQATDIEVDKGDLSIGIFAVGAVATGASRYINRFGRNQQNV